MTDDRDLARRLEMLALPVVVLESVGWLSQTYRDDVSRELQSTGINADGTAVAVWRDPGRRGICEVVVYAGSEVSWTAQVASELDIGHVQVSQDCEIYLHGWGGRVEHDTEIWAPDGHRTGSGRVGPVNRFLLSDSGGLWTAYSDQFVMSGKEPERNAVARFSAKLEFQWGLVDNTPLSIMDCYALNVGRRSVQCCTYTEFPLFSITEDRAALLGTSPLPGTHAVLLQGDRLALCFGYGPEFDLVLPCRLVDGGIEPGPPRRLVMPDGRELSRATTTCRGSELHFVTEDGDWHRTNVEALCAEPGELRRPK